MEVKKRAEIIQKWIDDYCNSAAFEIKSLVVGISGGVDSSVVSTLCALTGRKTIALSMPIRQQKNQQDLSIKHGNWLAKKFSNVKLNTIHLERIFNEFEKSMNQFNDENGFANSRARLRMTTLYQVAAANNGIVVGTGNKVEDFGVGFYTKYGDGGVDISPIADCTKTEVWELGKYLGIDNKIIEAEPTDGLWDDARTDIDQLGMSYQDLEKAMSDSNDSNYKKYLEVRKKNLHKMIPIPVCKFDE
jgi:NAD+ synthase